MSEHKLFLDGVFKLKGEGNDSPSVVYITIPDPSGKISDASPDLTGLMVGDPTWSAGTKWGPIINDVTNLQDVTSLMGEPSMFSWIGASTMCWKGTSPLSIGIDFYLINYTDKGLDLESKLRDFVKLASLYRDPDATVGADYKVLVHGGYAADVISGNKKWFTVGIKNLQDFRDNLDAGEMKELFDAGENAKGAVQLQFGHKSKIKNLLLSKVSVTESTIEVADQDGKNIKPLYYRVSAQFTGVRPLLTVDVDRMFTRP